MFISLMRHLELTNTLMWYLRKEFYKFLLFFWKVPVCRCSWFTWFVFFFFFYTFFMLSIDIQSTYCLCFLSVQSFHSAFTGKSSYVGLNLNEVVVTVNSTICVSGTTFLSTVSITPNLVSHSQTFDWSTLVLVHIAS